MEYLWLIVVGIGPFVLAGAAAYVLLTRRRLRTREREARDRSVRNMYGENPRPK